METFLGLVSALTAIERTEDRHASTGGTLGVVLIFLTKIVQDVTVVANESCQD